MRFWKRKKKLIEKETGTFHWDKLRVFIDDNEILVDSMELNYEIPAHNLRDYDIPKSNARLDIKTIKKE